MSDNLEINTNNQKPKSKIPGFRSGKTWKKVIASIGYAFIALFIFAMFSGGDGGTDTVSSPPKENSIEVSKKAYTEGIAAFNNNDLDKAETSLKKVIDKDPNYSDAQAKLKEIANTKSNNLLASAKTKLTNNDFSGAKSDLNSALNYNPNLEEAKNLLPQVEQQQQAYIEQQKQQEIANYKNSCQTYEYRVLNKNPDSLAGEKAKLSGNIMQIQEDGGQTFMLVQITNRGYDIWDDNVAIFYPGTIDVYENDKVTIWGEVRGAFSYESTAGWDLTVPSINAKYVEKGLL